MTVFKNTFKIIKHHKFSLLMYAGLFVIIVLLIQTLSSPSTNTGLMNQAPAIYLENHDRQPLAQGLESLLLTNSVADEKEISSEQVEDALFFGQVSAQIVIEKNFSKNFLSYQETNLIVKTTGDMAGSYIEGLVNQYLTTVKGYHAAGIKLSESIIDEIVEDLSIKTQINVMDSESQVNSTQANLETYFVLLNYPILAQIILSVGLVMATFKDDLIKKRHQVSSLSSTSITFQMLLGMVVISITTWAIFMLLGLILQFEGMRQFALAHLLNSFVLTLAVTTFAYFIGTVVKNKELVSTLSTVVALGVSFISGGFVPRELIADYVLNIAKFFPSFWYIDNARLIAGSSFTQIVSSNRWTNYWMHLLVMMGFALIFVLLSLFAHSYKAKNLIKNSNG